MNLKLPLAMVLLILVNACLLATLGWRLLEGSQREALLQVESGTPDVTFEAVDVPAVGSIDSIQARAVFHQSRSFYVAPPPQVVETPAPDYRLAGSMSVGGKQTAVLINGSGTRLRIGAGDQVDGWTVAAIVPGKVTLQLGDRLAEITPTSKIQGGGVTVTGAQAAVTAPVGSGVRVLGNAPLGAPRPSSTSDSSLNQAPRAYRPPVRQ